MCERRGCVLFNRVIECSRRRRVVYFCTQYNSIYNANILKIFIENVFQVRTMATLHTFYQTALSREVAFINFTL